MKHLELVVLCLTLTACSIDDPTASADDHEHTYTEQPTSNDEEMMIAPPPGYQPAYTLMVEVMESQPEQYSVSWSAEVNTGGWIMRTDRVEISDNTAMVYIELEQPAPDEIVTQALETLRGRYEAGMQVIANAELYVRRIVRGETGPKRAFQHVKSAGG